MMTIDRFSLVLAAMSAIAMFGCDVEPDPALAPIGELAQQVDRAAVGAGVVISGSTITAPTLNGGNNNDWAPAGSSTASLIKVATGTGWPNGFPFLTGIGGGIDGRRITIVLVSMGDPLTISRLDASSQPQNELTLPVPSSMPWLTMNAVDQSVTFEYDGPSGKWRLVAKNF